MFDKNGSGGEGPFSARRVTDFGLGQRHPAQLVRAVGPKGDIQLVRDQAVAGDESAGIFERAGLRKERGQRAVRAIGHVEIRGWHKARWLLGLKIQAHGRFQARGESADRFGNAGHGNIIIIPRRIAMQVNVIGTDERADAGGDRSGTPGRWLRNRARRLRPGPPGGQERRWRG